MSIDKVILNLSSYLTMDVSELALPENEEPLFIGRKGRVVYLKDAGAFRRYIDELYCEKHIEQYAYSVEEFIYLVIDIYIKFNGAETIEYDFAQEFECIDLKEYHVLLPIFHVHMYEPELTIGKNKLVKFQAISEYIKENNYCLPERMEEITQDKYFANIPFVDVVVNAREFHYAYDQAQLRLEEIIRLLNFILYSNYRGLEVISSITNSGTRDRHFIVNKDWCQISSSVHPSNVKELVLEDVLDFMLDERYGNRQLFDIFDKSGKNEIEKRISNAVNWVGMAIAEKNNSVAFTQAIYAIESLLQYEIKGEVINKSIVATISESIAFLLGKNLEDRKRVEKRFKELYGIRSKIAHGKSSEITAYQVLEAIDLAKSLVQELMTNSELNDASTMQKISNYITKLKYTVVGDVERN